MKNFSGYYFFYLIFFISCSNNNPTISENNNIKIDTNKYISYDTAVFISKSIKKIQLCSNEQMNNFIYDFKKFKNLKSIIIENVSDNNFENLFTCLSQIDSLEELSFRNISVKSKLSNKIGNLKNLKKIYFYANEKYNIPDSIVLLKKLEFLFISENVTISNNIDQLVNIKYLYLFGVAEFPDFIFNLKNLKYISIGDRINSIPEKICLLTNLKELDISSNPIAKRELYFYKQFDHLNELAFIKKCIPSCKITLERKLNPLCKVDNY